MRKVYERCCGIDVHKKIIIACFLCEDKQEVREFATNTRNLRELSLWLASNGCQMIAMESTGAYWKPLYNIFELSGLDAIVVNAGHVKNVPGRKTDVNDAEWIADLLSHGLLKASYVPSREQRELREISRYRMSLVEERSRELNRLQKMLEGANIKLSGVVSTINGASSRRIIQTLIEGRTLCSEEVSELLHVSMRGRLEEIMAAIDGIISPLQRKMIACVCSHIDDMSERIAQMDDLIISNIKDYEEAIERIDEVPGIGRRSAETILAEIGMDMSRFPTSGQLCRWSGVAPGNNESAGKRKSGRTTKGNSTLKKTLVQCAVAAVKNKASFFYAQYCRIAVRRGKRRAILAVAHSMLTSIYSMLKKGERYRELGADYYDHFNTQRKINGHLRKLMALGWTPEDTIQPRETIITTS